MVDEGTRLFGRADDPRGPVGSFVDGGRGTCEVYSRFLVWVPFTSVTAREEARRRETSSSSLSIVLLRPRIRSDGLRSFDSSGSSVPARLVRSIGALRASSGSSVWARRVRDNSKDDFRPAVGPSVGLATTLAEGVKLEAKRGLGRALADNNALLRLCSSLETVLGLVTKRRPRSAIGGRSD